MSSLAGEWKQGRVLALNIAYGAIKEFAEKAGIERTPTFILFDADGEEIRRWVGAVPELAELNPS